MKNRQPIFCAAIWFSSPYNSEFNNERLQLVSGAPTSTIALWWLQGFSVESHLFYFHPKISYLRLVRSIDKKLDLVLVLLLVWVRLFLLKPTQLFHDCGKAFGAFYC
jgi:hypothetical protein